MFSNCCVPCPVTCCWICGQPIVITPCDMVCSQTTTPLCMQSNVHSVQPAVHCCCCVCTSAANAQQQQSPSQTTAGTKPPEKSDHAVPEMQATPPVHVSNLESSPAKDILHPTPPISHKSMSNTSMTSVDTANLSDDSRKHHSEKHLKEKREKRDKGSDGGKSSADSKSKKSKSKKKKKKH
ncbi:hypothetical protein GJ496_005291 [Pomphorhynchus laevis]|nr:hypothetical protein GJ496_005291 [Pomphorhynchus laevis]